MILSAFQEKDNRINSGLAARRNEIIAVPADEVHIAHATPGGQLARLIPRLAAWGIPARTSQT